MFSLRILVWRGEDGTTTVNLMDANGKKPILMEVKADGTSSPRLTAQMETITRETIGFL
ncbi:MAG: hypothetical protein ACRD4L_13505 [Pyrinomonadaceae bacterium]